MTAPPARPDRGEREARRIRADEADDLRIARLAMLGDEPYRAAFLRREEEFGEDNWLRRAAEGASSDEFATFVVPAEHGWAGVTDVFRRGSDTTDIGGTWVYPEHRRRGAGRALLEAAVRWSAERGARQVSLSVVTSNRAAIALYESAGFRLDGEPILARTSPTLLQRMTRRLGA
jgi:ribosomal protein S18 acetylase RimI-like enzyme